MNKGPQKDAESGEKQMLEIANGTREAIASAAKKMLASKETTVPFRSPDGNPMFYISTDASALSIAFMEVQVDGTTVYVGMPAD